MKSIFTLLAIVLGGWWTWHTFNALGTVNKARAEEEKIQFDMLDTKQRLDKQGIINGQIVASQKTLPGDKGRYLAAVVTLTNVGARNVQMCFEEPVDKEHPTSNCDAPTEAQSSGPRPRIRPPFNIARARFDQLGNLAFDTEIGVPVFREDDPSLPAKGGIVRAGEVMSYSAVVRVPSPGLYRVAFAFYLRPADTQMPLPLKPLLGG